MRQQLAEQLLQSSTQKGDPDQLLAVREHIIQAASLLKQLGPNYEKVGWLVEDTLTFLDEAEFEDTVDFDTAVEGSFEEAFNIQRAKVIIGIGDDDVESAPKANKRRRKASSR